MANVTVSDLIADASLEADGMSIKATRKFLVENLSTDQTYRLYQAASLPELPKIGARHPTIPFLFCSSIRAQPASTSDPSKAHVWVVYQTLRRDGSNQSPSTSGQCTIEFGATVSSINTSVDKDGNEIILQATRAATTTNPSPIALPNQPASISINESHPYVTFSRPEPLVRDLSVVKYFVNSVNSNGWFGDAPRTWYCAAIRYVPQGDHFQASYEFQYRAKTWDVSLIYTDPDTGAPIDLSTLVDKTVAQKTVRVYQETDFTALVLGV